MPEIKSALVIDSQQKNTLHFVCRFKIAYEILCSNQHCIKYLVSLLMSKVSQRSQALQISFRQGMTLEQYMSKLTFSNRQEDASSLQKDQQNLYESSANPQGQLPINQKKTYFMQGIYEQSEDDLRESLSDAHQKNELPEQKTKATFKQLEQTQEKHFSFQSRNRMNNTAYFGSGANEKNSFRVKHISNSPAKNSKQAKFSNFSMTLHGAKFNFSKEKESKKMSQLMTFYGKKPGEEHIQKQAQLKKVESKRCIKKKNPLEFHLFQAEIKVKSKLSTKIFFPEIKIEGLKDKILERKNKFW